MQYSGETHLYTKCYKEFFEDRIEELEKALEYAKKKFDPESGRVQIVQNTLDLNRRLMRKIFR
jgi:hypothetical protein